MIDAQLPLPVPSLPLVAFATFATFHNCNRHPGYHVAERFPPHRREYRSLQEQSVVPPADASAEMLRSWTAISGGQPHNWPIARRDGKRRPNGSFATIFPMTPASSLSKA